MAVPLFFTDPTSIAITLNLISSGIALGLSKVSSKLFRPEEISDYLRSISFQNRLEQEVGSTELSDNDIKILEVFIQSGIMSDSISQIYLHNGKSYEEIENEFIESFCETWPKKEQSNKVFAQKIFSLANQALDEVIQWRIAQGDHLSLEYRNEVRYKELGSKIDRMQKAIEKQPLNIQSIIEERNTQKNSESYYVLWEIASSLKRNKLLMVRDFNDYYYERDEDQKIRNSINNGENVLVIGRPLSGKTRAIYEAIIRTSDCQIAIPKEGKNIQFIKPSSDSRKKIIVFDDLNYFTKDLWCAKYLFGDLEENNVQIVATCRSGKELIDTINDLDKNQIDFSMLFSKNNIIELTNIPCDEGKKIAEITKKNWDEREFDGTIGSIFMSINNMRCRFNGFSSEKKVLKDILITTSLLHKCGLYKEKQVFSLEWMKIVCDKHFGFKMILSEWENSLSELEQNHFIKNEIHNRVCVEEVYLERLFTPTIPISDLVLFRNMIDYFSEYPEVFFDCPEVLFRFANNAYYVIGIADDKKAKLHYLAKTVCENAIKKTPNRSIEYAHFQKLLGISYRVISEMNEKDKKDQISHAEKAIQSSIEASNIFESKKEFLKEYAICKSNLGTAYRHFSELIPHPEEKRNCCENGIAACEIALQIKEYPRTYRATTLNILGALHRILGEIENNEKNYSQALYNCAKAKDYCKEALGIYQNDNLNLQVATTQYLFGKIYKLVAEVENSTEYCYKSINCLEKSLNVRTFKDFKTDYARTQVFLGDAYSLLSKFDNNPTIIANAKTAYEAALMVYSESEFPRSYQIVKSKIANVNN